LDLLIQSIQRKPGSTETVEPGFLDEVGQDVSGSTVSVEPSSNPLRGLYRPDLTGFHIPFLISTAALLRNVEARAAKPFM
jgi:hypothetical protein